ncbi:CCA tRNA nucleotidyltransferase [Arenibaculum sp.]|uniref:CCA tRNA nucleotidyltransferase n=1 Tax=Arenibaculum sp. TaxID=2865862 RepID=UPI002E0F828E|nr:CCA tRNA nucleotidyltransferase [Arenibaculum sp.]
MTERLRLALPPALSAAAVGRVLDALARGGAEVRFVGGCVRDAILGRPVRDVDLATDALPQGVMALLRAAGIGVVPTGVAHGTVTAVVDGTPVEVTTLRRDVETDGRRAVVDFTDDWREDAARRDFTMNALSLSPDGTVHDFFGGIADARAGRVLFVGDPEARIREDVLRILRFFRFQAHYGRGAPDAAALAACRRLAPLLPRLSGERVRAELLRLLEAPDPAPVWRLMADEGVLARLLPEAADLGRLDALAGLERAGGAAPDPLRRLAALLPGSAAAALDVAARLRLSNRERDRLVLLAEPPLAVDPSSPDRGNRRALHRLGAAHFADLVLLEAAARRLGRAAIEPALAAAAAWRPVSFPLAGRDLQARGVPPGTGMGRLLKELEAWWEDRDYRPDRAACLAELERRLGHG